MKGKKKKNFSSQKSKNNETNEQKDNSENVSKGCSSFLCILILSISVLLTSIFIGYIFYNVNNLKKLEPVKYNDIVKDVSSNKWFYMKNFFENETIELFKEIILNEIPMSTVVEDNSVESAGEAVEIGHVDCRHPYMTLNLNRTLCHFSNRLG